jgi:predicted anti-sigma-YlaC factor YlaD
VQSERSLQHVALIAIAIAALSGCAAVGRMAVNRVGDGLSGGSSTFASDEDPDLVLAAIPFGLKTYESLLDVSPKHPGLLRSAASGFAAYAFLLRQQAQLDDRADYVARKSLDNRVSRLYLRARDYALRGLALEHPNLPSQLVVDPATALETTRKADVPFLYWAGVSWAGAISAAKDDPQLLAELPIAAALMSRVLELDEGFDAGAIHEFFVTYEGSRPGGDAEAARLHYARACELSHGDRASVYLALAESVSVREQNAEEFRMLLQRALAIDPNDVAQWRVANTLARRRAAWLNAHVSDLFIDVQEN